MLFDQLNEADINFLPHLVAGDGAKLAGWNFDRQIKLAAVSNIHDDGILASIACEEMRNVFNRLLRGGESNAHRRATA